jgi:hypothetical protein
MTNTGWEKESQRHRDAHYKGIQKKIGTSQKVNKEEIKGIVQSNSFLNLREPLTNAGYVVNFLYDPVPHYTVRTNKNTKGAIIVNKKYADDAEFIIGEIAVGDE